MGVGGCSVRSSDPVCVFARVLGLDNTATELCDFYHVLSALEAKNWGIKLGLGIDSCLRKIDECSPHKINKELVYYHNLVNYEVLYFATQAYAKAHEKAQRTVIQHFGAKNTPETLEEISLCLESAVR